jgi:propionyl-CoA carboxylase alpha chain
LFAKILIANRGEIACRIIRTARAMGIRTVAVYSDADRDALHVEMADEAVAIGPAPAAQSYLRIEEILRACRETGAEAVHPGYGFLSERAAFAGALAEAGVAFIGPNARAIAAMGDKIESKKLAVAAGVSTVPGFAGRVTDEDHARTLAAEIGYPVMVKASAGGGGKGLRIVHKEADLARAIASSQSEARASFGDDRLFIEKFITQPRHIEIQVLGDRHGNLIHLGERECSIQRRHQKVIEEAPSPFLDAPTRAAMGAQAVALARAVGYDSAGTVEFVVDGARNFYFLEMNTRLQVEHPVTELVTGLDLVEWMIRIAAGEKLSLRQKDVRQDGWAVEGRIYAEDPCRGFLPSTGRLVRYRPPPDDTQADHAVRNDSGVQEGGEIPIHYDPMIAKLSAHAPTRLEAIDTLAGALDEFLIEGIAHNISFLAAVMHNKHFREGRFTTAFIAEEYPEGFHGAPLDPAAIRRFIAAAIAAKLRRTERASRIEGTLNGPHRAAGDFAVRLGQQDFAVTDACLAEDQLHLSIDGKAFAALTEWFPGQPILYLQEGHRRTAVRIARHAGGYRLEQGGARVLVTVRSAAAAKLASLMPEKPADGLSRFLLCPMPGLVVSIAVREGQAVKAGDVLAMVEAMKMENILLADRDGTVKAIRAQKGDSLALDDVILEFS